MGKQALEQFQVYNLSLLQVVWDGFAPRTAPDIVPRDADVQDQNALSSEKRSLLQTLWKASFRRQSLCPIGLIVAKSHIRLSHSN